MVVALLTACSSGGGVVVFAPTPLPQGQTLATYNHPAGAFSIVLPQHWGIYSSQTPTLASASFYAPESTSPTIRASVVHLDADSLDSDLASIVNRYQDSAGFGAGRYAEYDRQPLPDGSWRLSGLRINTGGLSEQVNIFVIQAGEYVATLETTLSTDNNLQAQIERAINTFVINTETALQPAGIDALTQDTIGAITVSNVHSWSTSAGIYFVTGEVNNNGDIQLNSVPIRLRFLGPAGEINAEATDVTMGYGVPAGGYAPFSLRFGQGQPPNTVLFDLELGTDEWRQTLSSIEPFVNASQFTWTDASTITPEGHLLISGNVTNTGSTAVREAIAIATVFDARRTVIAAGFVSLDQSQLDIGEATTFNLRIPEMGGEPINYIVEIQALPDAR